jgi:hypothetical protein
MVAPHTHCEACSSMKCACLFLTASPLDSCVVLFGKDLKALNLFWAKVLPLPLVETSTHILSIDRRLTHPFVITYKPFNRRTDVLWPPASRGNVSV